MKSEAKHAFDAGRWEPSEAAEALRAHGCRVTGPRVAVLRALLSHGGTISAPELAALAQEFEPGIHEATVYRTVNVLNEVGIASHVHAGHGPSLVRLAGDHQLVAMCQDCGSIESVPPEAISALVAAMSEATSFQLEPGHFALEGVCSSCAT